MKKQTKTQLNLRVSSATRDKLEWLRENSFGTFVEAIAIAVDQLYKNERRKGMKTLSELGTPWAETYRGSGRLTGRLADQPTRMENGDVAPGWSFVGNITEDEFYSQFEIEEHQHCHTPQRADWACRYCQEAGWIG